MFQRNLETANPNRNRRVMLMASLLLPVVANAQPAAVRDIFIGMVVEDQGQLVLERCDLGGTRYTLSNATDADDPLGKLRILRHDHALVQAELIASYRQVGDTHILDVSDVGDTRTGKSCHLKDALDDMLSDAMEPPRALQHGVPDAALVGHYYLSGVMETGSELRLKADGRFDWYISYGAVDQVANGHWGRKDDTVTLAADLPAKGKPVFRADERLVWDEFVERQFREQARLKQEAAVLALCPWNIAAASSAPPVATDEHPVAGPEQVAKAARTKVAAEIARDAAAAAAAKAVAGGAGDADRDAASAAMAAWQNAQYDMEQAHVAANLAVPLIDPPLMPAACRLPDEDRWAKIPVSEWQRGIAVLVGDPVIELQLSRVGVTFTYDDGHQEMARTARGWAFAPLRPGAAVTRLDLAMPSPVSRSETLRIAPLAEGVQTVIANMQQVIEPPFEVMTLEVKGRDLIPADMPRGRYSRH